MFHPHYSSNNFRFVRRFGQMNGKQKNTTNQHNDLLNFWLMSLLGSVNCYYLIDEKKPEYNEREKQNRVMSGALATITFLGSGYHLLRYLKK